PVAVVPDVRVAGRAQERHRRALWTPAPGGGRRGLPHHRQEGHEAQRGDARHSGRRRHLSGLGGRGEGRERAAPVAAHGPALLPLLTSSTRGEPGSRPGPRPSRSRVPMNLRLLQIADSALPISGYTHSWGLESAISRGLVHDAESLERWTARWLRTS